MTTSHPAAHTCKLQKHAKGIYSRGGGEKKQKQTTDSDEERIKAVREPKGALPGPSKRTRAPTKIFRNAFTLQLPKQRQRLKDKKQKQTK